MSWEVEKKLAVERGGNAMYKEMRRDERRGCGGGE